MAPTLYTFPFLIDIETQPKQERDHQAQGHTAIDHMEAAFPMLTKQRDLLKLITTDRQEHHRMKKSAGRNTTVFRPGNI